MDEWRISSRRRIVPNWREFRLKAGNIGLESQVKIGVDIASLEGRSNDELASQ